MIRPFPPSDPSDHLPLAVGRMDAVRPSSPLEGEVSGAAGRWGALAILVLSLTALIAAPAMAQQPGQGAFERARAAYAMNDFSRAQIAAA